MQVTPLSPALGAEVTSVDTANINNDEFSQLRQAWNDAGGLLVIRDQYIEPGQQVAFARRFGQLFGEEDQFQESVLKKY